MNIDGKIRISAVRYANTYPFIYGIQESGFAERIILETDHPAQCASKLASGSVDIGLIPVAALPLIKDYRIITDYCLGAYGKVRTVMLLSNCPFDEIMTVYLDYRSVSSVTLVKILAAKAWKKKFNWATTASEFDFTGIRNNEAVVLIGDQCFEYESRFRYKTDLAEQWYNFTGLPFAFACWTSNRELDCSFIDDFNRALGTGVNNIPAVVRKFGNNGPIKGTDLMQYLSINIDFHLNNDKRKAIDLFLNYLKEL
jgi:chorismate dehydratase